jgi:hypothetical protein
VAADRACARYRPEEIAAATACATRPVPFDIAAPAGAEARSTLLALARRAATCPGP